MPRCIHAFIPVQIYSSTDTSTRTARHSTYLGKEHFGDVSVAGGLVEEADAHDRGHLHVVRHVQLRRGGRQQGWHVDAQGPHCDTVHCASPVVSGGGVGWWWWSWSVVVGLVSGGEGVWWFEERWGFQWGCWMKLLGVFGGVGVEVGMFISIFGVLLVKGWRCCGCRSPP